MARDGAGVAVLDRLCAPSIDMTGAVMHPLAPERWVSFGYVHTERDGLSQAARIFVACMREAIAEIRARSAADHASIVPTD